jgi:hypothetical protein
MRLDPPFVLGEGEVKVEAFLGLDHDWGSGEAQLLRFLYGIGIVAIDHNEVGYGASDDSNIIVRVQFAEPFVYVIFAG